jgi:hypothetical protein
MKGFFMSQMHLPAILAAMLTVAPSLVRADTYKGFHINYSQVQNSPKLDLIKAAMDRQVDMVTEVGLPENILNFLRRVPVVVLAGQQNFGGRYVQKLKHVEIPESFLLHGVKPSLLHEFLHSYHDQVIAYGFQNRKIIAYYQRAKELKVYDLKSHMMANQMEYFASAGTAYLFGVTELEPFAREKVKDGQPFFYQYLQQLFGPSAGTYQGSLTEHIDVLKEADKSIKASEQNGE